MRDPGRRNYPMRVALINHHVETILTTKPTSSPHGLTPPSLLLLHKLMPSPLLSAPAAAHIFASRTHATSTFTASQTYAESPDVCPCHRPHLRFTDSRCLCFYRFTNLCRVPCCLPCRHPYLHLTNSRHLRFRHSPPCFQAHQMLPKSNPRPTEHKNTLTFQGWTTAMPPDNEATTSKSS
jgi:hypothetical protein